LGIKMPAKGSTHMDLEVGVMERLERYRLGNIPPPHGVRSSPASSTFEADEIEYSSGRIR